MGLFMSYLLSNILGKKPMRILMLGLDAAGKTTILYQFKLGEVIHTVPTIGFNVETVDYKNLSFTVWDIGGQDKIRSLWRHYYKDANGIIFVIDSTDRERIDEVHDELQDLLKEESLSTSAVLLIYANKQDQKTAMKPSEIIDKLELNQIRNRRWFVQGSSAKDGNGLYQGLNWLSKQLS